MWMPRCHFVDGNVKEDSLQDLTAMLPMQVVDGLRWNHTVEVVSGGSDERVSVQKKFLIRRKIHCTQH